MSIRVNGKSGMIKQPTQRQYIQGTGWVNVLSWRGPKKDAPGLEAQLVDAGYDVLTVPTSPVNVLVTATIGTDDSAGTETPIDRWEATVVEDRVDVLDSTLSYGLADADIINLEAWIRNSSDEARPDPTLTTDDAMEILKLVKRGFKSVEIEKSVVRFTRTVSRRYARSVRLANVGRVFTTAQMVSIEGAPAEVLEEFTGEIPTRLAGVGARYGYKKKKPHMFQIPGARWQIIIEWEAGLWPAFPFPNATA